MAVILLNRCCTWLLIKSAASRRWIICTRFNFQFQFANFFTGVLQAWRMEAAHAHLRTLDWVLHQEPYDGSDAQESVDREEEMIRLREVAQDVDMEECEEEVDCAFTTKSTVLPPSFLEFKVDEAQVQPPLSPRRTRSGAILTPISRDEAMSEGNSEEGPSFSPRRTRNGAFY